MADAIVTVDTRLHRHVLALVPERVVDLFEVGGNSPELRGFFGDDPDEIFDIDIERAEMSLLLIDRFVLAAPQRGLFPLPLVEGGGIGLPVRSPVLTGESGVQRGQALVQLARDFRLLVVGVL
jgi:hypothetical protein